MNRRAFVALAASALIPYAIGADSGPRVLGRTVTSVTLLEHQGLNIRHARLAEPTEVRSFLAGLVLLPKFPCRCAHQTSILFETTDGEMRASVCKHCFDLVAGHRKMRRWMPPGFYERFVETLDSRGIDSLVSINGPNMPLQLPGVARNGRR